MGTAGGAAEVPVGTGYVFTCESKVHNYGGGLTGKYDCGEEKKGICHAESEHLVRVLCFSTDFASRQFSFPLRSKPPVRRRRIPDQHLILLSPKEKHEKGSTIIPQNM